jgi:uncharacterized protein YkwD
MFSRLRARVCATLLVLIGSLGIAVSAAPAASAATDPNPIAHAIFDLINSERAANGVPAMTSDPSLRSAAHSHNLTMARWNTLSHQLPGEPPFYTRISNTGYRWSYCAENVAWNGDMSQNGGLALEVMMYNETAPYNSHRANILSRTYTQVGVDVYLDYTHHKLWLTEDFARHA